LEANLRGEKVCIFNVGPGRHFALLQHWSQM